MSSLNTRKLSSALLVDAVEMSSNPFVPLDGYVHINGHKFALLPGNRLDIKSMMGHDVLLLDSKGVVVPSEFGFVTLSPGQSYNTMSTNKLVPAKEVSAPAASTFSGAITTSPTFLSPIEVEEYLTKVGASRPTSPLLKQIWGGIMCGFFVVIGGLVAFGAAGGFSAASRADHPIIAKLAMALTFPVALVLIVMYGGELFTGNTMYLFMAYMHRKVTIWQLLRNYLTSWCTNFIGCLFFGWMLGYETKLFTTDPYLTVVTATCEKKVHLDWGVAFLRGIGANALVNLAVWMSTVGKDNVSRIVAMFMPIFTFVIIGFEHSVANMFFLPLGLMYGAKYTVGDMLAKNIIPVSLGNIVGGAIVVGASAVFLHGFNPLFLESGEDSIWWKIWTFGSDTEASLREKRAAFIKAQTVAPIQVQVVPTNPIAKETTSVKKLTPDVPSTPSLKSQPGAPEKVVYRPGDGEILRYTKRYVHKSGKVIYVAVEASLVVEGGLPSRFVAFVTPLQGASKSNSSNSAEAHCETNQKIIFRWGDREEHMEVGLAPSQDLQPVPEAKRGFCVLRALDRVFIEVDDAYCDLLGYSRAELIGKDVEFVTCPEDEAVTQNILCKKMRSMSKETQPLLEEGRS